MPAAERGNARAQAYLGFMHQYGRGVPQNYALAIYWYRRGAEQGNPTAQHLLGLMYDKGMGVPTDHVAAHIWLNLAAARTKGAEHEDNVRLRDAVASKMSLGQLADAQYFASVWVPKPEAHDPLSSSGCAGSCSARTSIRRAWAPGGARIGGRPAVTRSKPARNRQVRSDAWSACFSRSVASRPLTERNTQPG